MSVGASRGPALTKTVASYRPKFSPMQDDDEGKALNNFVEFNVPPGYRATIVRVDWNVQLNGEDIGPNPTEHANVLAHLGTGTIDIDHFDLAGTEELNNNEEDGTLDGVCGMALWPTSQAEGLHAGHFFNYHGTWEADHSEPVELTSQVPFGIDIVANIRAQRDVVGEMNLFVSAAMTVTYTLDRDD